jgi:RNA polymerase sigma factor (sigma-70 family)
MSKRGATAAPSSEQRTPFEYAQTVPSVAGEISLTDLVTKARDGDQEAWRLLVARIKNVIWKTVNGFRLGRGDAEDAFAATLFRLAEHIDTIREPERLAGWVATTARNESLAILRRNRRAMALDPTDAITAGDHESRLVDNELKQAIRQSFRLLSEACQQLLRLLTTDPPLAYDEIASVLDMPMGSIGPNRQRCLERLRAARPLREYTTETHR